MSEIVEVGQECRMKQDIKSFVRKARLYAEKNEKAIVTSVEYLPILICQGKRELFSVHIDNVTILPKK